MPRRTKIVATLGPATDPPEKMQALISAGANVVRINLSHGSQEEHKKRILDAKAIAKSLDKSLGILVDLQGPKVRIARFEDPEGICLEEGQRFILDAKWPSDEGNVTRVGLAYPQLPQDVKAGDTLLLDDGRIVLQVEAVEGAQIICKIG